MTSTAMHSWEKFWPMYCLYYMSHMLLECMLCHSVATKKDGATTVPCQWYVAWWLWNIS